MPTMRYIIFLSGLAYLNSTGVKQDYQEAAKIFQEISEEPYSSLFYGAEADMILANMYLNGLGVGKSQKKAVDYYVNAAFRGNIDAILKLHELYRPGVGVWQDKAQADEWLKVYQNGEKFLINIKEMPYMNLYKISGLF